MAAGTELLLVGERDLLATIASPATGPAALPRPLGSDPAETAARALALGPSLVVVFRPQPGELEAIGKAGSTAVGWPHEWFPVADELFSDEAPRPEPSRVFFSGSASERRDRFLQPVKHRFDVLHLAGGADPIELAGLMGRCTTAIDLAPEPGLAEVDRIGPAMAAGMLVVAEAASVTGDLIPGEHLLTFNSPDELELLISDVTREPGSFANVVRAGTALAQKWRASEVLPDEVWG